MLERVTAGLRRVEDAVLVAIFAGVVVLPIIEALGRPIRGFHVPGAAQYLRQMVLWLSFLGGLIVTRERKHLRLSTAEAIPEGRWRDSARAFSMGVAAAVCVVLAYAAWQVVQVNRISPKTLSIGLPEWVSEIVMPGALALIALRFIWHASDRWRGRLVALAIAPLGALLDFTPNLVEAQLWPLVGLILAAALLGAPVFVAMAGVAMLLTYESSSPVAGVAAEVYRLVGSPAMPAIPLLTACGYILAESKAAERLVRFFKALFGWMPGGVAVLVAGVCALFTTFTGGSGVTIIALGGLAYGILREDGYPSGFSLGLITASGSLGLLPGISDASSAYFLHPMWVLSSFLEDSEVEAAVVELAGSSPVEWAHLLEETSLRRASAPSHPQEEVGDAVHFEKVRSEIWAT